ncbi:MAG: DUF5615 family PIN-like protein [Methanobacteriota archaeon]
MNFLAAEKYAGISDDEVLEMANKKNTLLLTADKDFGELVFRQLQGQLVAIHPAQPHFALHGAGGVIFIS